MFDLWLKTLSDIKEPAILWRLFIPFAAAIVMVSLMGYGIFGFLIFSDVVTQNPLVMQFDEWQTAAESTIGAIPFVGGVLLWIIGFLAAVVAGVLGVLLGSYLVLLFAMIITGFMTDSLVKVVRDKHYPGLDYVGHGSTLDMLWKLLKFGLLMLLLFLVTIPMLFIPVVNIVWFWLLGFLFFRYSVILDVGQVILPQARFEETKGMTNWAPTNFLGSLFLLSNFPLAGLFMPVLGVIGMAHYYFDDLSKLPKEETIGSGEAL
ncbi:EI24 domain-containing protein [Thiomicrorhabdus indica]|uniref:EI24 domain-containing protein n=1 Tax=Thiomicrorhabdus indica TaxID=2267253 RepID=UPI002AA93CB0|nr:EI24 domain-containing protein [Thiomicrorhabdus indica]